MTGHQPAAGGPLPRRRCLAACLAILLAVGHGDDARAQPTSCTGQSIEKLERICRAAPKEGVAQTTDLEECAALSAMGDASGANALKEPPPKQARIGTFNIRIFSNARSDAAVDRIARLLLNLDIVAIQELRHAEVLDRLRKRLAAHTGTKWDAVVSKPVGTGQKELMAFVYRTDRVQPTKAGKLVSDRTFDRPPFYAGFRSGKLDFTLVTAHIFFSRIDQRKRELEALAKAYRRIEAEDPEETDVILLGDFNECYESPRFAPIRSIEGMDCAVRQGKALQPRTTIDDISLYDNICFRRTARSGLAGSLGDGPGWLPWPAGILAFDRYIAEADMRQARIDISDHRPLAIRFCTDLDLDGPGAKKRENRC